MRWVMPYFAIMSCVGGWYEPARRSCVRDGSASHTTTGMPCAPSASAHMSPVGPAPAITTGGRSMPGFYKMPPMRICIFGAGSVGGHLAARLAAAGHEVSVVARGAHLEAMSSRGVKLLHGDEVIAGRVRTADIGVQDAVFVTVKANALGGFVEAAAPLLGPATAVVFAQNGIPWWYAEDLPALDPGGKLRNLVLRQNVVGGVVYSANEVVEPGVIRNFVPGNNMLVI